MSERNFSQIEENAGEWSIEKGNILASNDKRESSEDDDVEYIIKELPQGYVGFEKNNVAGQFQNV